MTTKITHVLTLFISCALPALPLYSGEVNFSAKVSAELVSLLDDGNALKVLLAAENNTETSVVYEEVISDFRLDSGFLHFAFGERGQSKSLIQESFGVTKIGQSVYSKSVGNLIDGKYTLSDGSNIVSNIDPSLNVGNTSVLINQDLLSYVYLSQPEIGRKLTLTRYELTDGVSAALISDDELSVKITVNGAAFFTVPILKSPYSIHAEFAESSSVAENNRERINRLEYDMRFAKPFPGNSNYDSRTSDFSIMVTPGSAFVDSDATNLVSADGKYFFFAAGEKTRRTHLEAIAWQEYEPGNYPFLYFIPGPAKGGYSGNETTDVQVEYLDGTLVTLDKRGVNSLFGGLLNPFPDKKVKRFLLKSTGRNESGDAGMGPTYIVEDLALAIDYSNDLGGSFKVMLQGGNLWRLSEFFECYAYLLYSDSEKSDDFFFEDLEVDVLSNRDQPILKIMLCFSVKRSAIGKGDLNFWIESILLQASTNK